MLAYGWSFLLIATLVGAFAFAGYAGTYAFSAKVAAFLCLLFSLIAFVAEKREHA